MFIVCLAFDRGRRMSVTLITERVDNSDASSRWLLLVILLPLFHQLFGLQYHFPLYTLRAEIKNYACG